MRQKVSTVKSSATAVLRTMLMSQRKTSPWYCRKSVSKASTSPAANRSSSSMHRLYLHLLPGKLRGYIISGAALGNGYKDTGQASTVVGSWRTVEGGVGQPSFYRRPPQVASDPEPMPRCGGQ